MNPSTKAHIAALHVNPAWQHIVRLFDGLRHDAILEIEMAPGGDHPRAIDASSRLQHLNQLRARIENDLPEAFKIGT